MKLVLVVVAGFVVGGGLGSGLALAIPHPVAATVDDYVDVDVDDSENILELYERWESTLPPPNPRIVPVLIPWSTLGTATGWFHE
jgi:hypothetical protein